MFYTTGEFTPVTRRNLSDEIAERITDSIAAGDFHEGERLPSIGEMARLFCVAKPTVREALRSVAAIGVVETRHGVGTYVRRGVTGR